MSIYAIGDLHLSGQPPKKPMEVFGGHWADHKEKIKANWLRTVQDKDTVLICGDISWAMAMTEAAEDLQWLGSLPGRKLLLRGNHDYWWGSLAKMQAMYPQFEFLQNGAVLVEGMAVCGIRGWVLPSAEGFTTEDEKIYKREAIRLELCLQAAKKLNAQGIIAGLHYPPLFSEDEHNALTDLLEQYAVGHCVYGHIHGLDHVQTFEGERAGVRYKLVSCDTQGFRLYKIL